MSEKDFSHLSLLYARVIRSAFTSQTSLLNMVVYIRFIN